MPTTRSSHRAKPSSQSDTKTGTKRSSNKNFTNTPAKRGKTSENEREHDTSQTTNTGEHNSDAIGNEKPKKVDDKSEEDYHTRNKPSEKEVERENSIHDGEESISAHTKADDEQGKEIPKEEQPQKSVEIGRKGTSTTEGDKHEADISSSILEKGIIYFFFRGRVGVEEPEGIQDVARSYIVLRPLPTGAKIAEEHLDDSRNARLLALPKKMLPKKHGDGFLAFVEKSASSIKDLRNQFSDTEYATKTSGTSHIPAATPFAEGVYEITSTGQESHLAYKTTYPEIGEVQNELGVHEKGGYIVSVKNPEFPGPGNATIGHPPAYPESIQKKFRGLRWMPLVPELLDYDNTQLLVIGEELDVVGKSAEEVSEDQRSGKGEALWSELDKHAHDVRNHIKHCNRVFADLEESSKEYPKMQTTW